MTGEAPVQAGRAGSVFSMKKEAVMGDTGNKDKNRKQQQKMNKQNEEARRKQEKQQKKPEQMPHR